MKKNNIILSIVTVLLAGTMFTGCDDSTDDNTITAISGQATDNYIKDLDYTCGTNNTIYKTGINGEFKCEVGPVQFQIGNIVLGEIFNNTEDGNVFPQDIINIDRNNTSDVNVIAMAQFLQSLDVDGDPTNGIDISEDIVNEINQDFIKGEKFDPNKSIEALEQHQIQIKTQEEAKLHLEYTLEKVEYINNLNLNNFEKEVINTINFPIDVEMDEATLYFLNELKMENDLYKHFNELYPDLESFKSETINDIKNEYQLINSIIEKYNINISSASINNNNINFDKEDIEKNPGEYSVDNITSLYEDLTIDGELSEIDALKVGCKITTNNINDALGQIEMGNVIGSFDTNILFEYIANVNYKNYWNFDNELKNKGEVDGCCSLGSEYCNTEYPTNITNVESYMENKYPNIKEQLQQEIEDFIENNI